jgi:ABC-type transporter MlaC component
MAASGARALTLNGPAAPTVSRPQTSPSQTAHAQNRTALGSRAVGADDITVSTQILYVNYPPLNVGWRVRNGQQRLRIVDVVVEEISFVVTNRAEFASIVERRGINGLLQDLRARAPEPR